MKPRSLLFLVPVVFTLLYFVLSYSLPFWGDSVASVSKAAVRIYKEGLDRPWNYADADPGHPTLFPWLIALLWRIFGMQLWVPHALTAFCYYFLLRLLSDYLRIYDERLRLWGMLFWCVSPLLVSQALGISLQLPLTLCFFMAVQGLKKENYLLWVTGICLMPLIHIQGVLLLAALGIYDIWRSWPLQKEWWKRFPFYLMPAALLLTWWYFHEKEFGWALVSPNFQRTSPGMGRAFYNLTLAAWRLADLGYFLLLIPALLTVLLKLRKKLTSDLDHLFIPVFLILCVGIPVLFAYPPGHRYFLPVYILLVPLFLRFLTKKTEKRQLVWALGAFLVLLSGNIWFYPGKCQGDQNLVFLGYHTLEKEMMEDLPKGSLIHSYAPLNNDPKYTFLNVEREIRYTDLYSKISGNTTIDSLELVVESNLNCEFMPEERKILREKFSARSYESFGVYVNLWVNKTYAAKYDHIHFNGPHEPSFVEREIDALKRKLRGS